MPQAAATTFCQLESWDTSSRTWVPDASRHASIADATAAATERGVYRVVVVNGDRRLEIDAFAIV